MKTKVREGKVIVGIAMAAIMVASIFAMVAPTSMAGTNEWFPPEEEPASSIRIYGDVQPQGNAPAQYTDYLDPFDPTVIPKDSITYNPAIIEESHEDGEPYYRVLIGTAAGSPENAREKIFLRSWYEPCGQYNGPRKNDTHPTINMEYTYMLMNTLYLPAYGTEGKTQFLVPTCEIDTQTGLGAWKSGTNVDNITTLASVSGDVGPDGTTVEGSIALEKQFTPVVGSAVRFFDHKVELTSVNEDGGGEYVIKVGYTGNAQDDAEKGWISLKRQETKYFDRHNNEYDILHKGGATWYVRRNGPLIYVGKELNYGGVFYVDAVRYDITAVAVLNTTNDDGSDADAFKYLTLRTKLPKGVGSVRDESVVSTQFIDGIEPGEIIPMLPPFNMKHDMVDDIDIPLWISAAEERDWTRQDYTGSTELTDSDGDWIAYDVEMRVIDDIDPLEVTYISEQVEERYSTNLLEKLQEDWKGNIPKDLFLIVDSSQNLAMHGFFDLQRDGLASAIYTIPQDGTVSVCVIQFSDVARIEVPLTTITPDTVNSVAMKIQKMKAIDKDTNMIAAFDKVKTLIEENPDASEHQQIIDISSDGRIPSGEVDATLAAKDALVAIDPDNIVINVFGLGNYLDNEIDEVFLRNLTHNGFYVYANDPEDIVDKTKEKVRLETPGLIVESWSKFDIQSLPDQYTEFVLPALPDYYTLPGVTWPVNLDGDYLITTSWIAPQVRGTHALRDNKRGGDLTEQRVAFSYDPKDGEDGNDIYVYYDEELKEGTVKIYGNGSDSTVHIEPTNYCNIEEYENWADPFNPTAIRKDSITFDAAILPYSEEYPTNANDENCDLKEYLRAWYVPEYKFYGWHDIEGKEPAIVIETTYMLIDSQDKKPYHADEGSWFPFPIVSTDKQIGLDSFENEGVESKRENLVRLASVSCDPLDIGNRLPKTTNGTISIEKTYIMAKGDEVQFLDHSLLFDGYDISDDFPMVYISYLGNPEPEDGVQNFLNPIDGKKYFDRHSFDTTKKHPDRTWYAKYEGRFSGDKALITVGKELQRGDIFYVDGVRYEIPAIEVLDSDGKINFKYITLRTPFPKYLDDGEYTLRQHYLPCADSQWLTKVETCYPLLALPVLPPMNIEHDIVDDTDVVLWQPLKLLDKWPYGDIDTGKAGREYFPCGERYLTMQYPPAAWLKFFRAVPIDTDGDMRSPRIPSDWQLWSDYGGPFYPGDVAVAVPNGWQCCECGIPMPLPATFKVFDTEHWIANDVDERIIEDVDPLEFCWKDEMPEPRYSTNLLEILNENGLIESWTKFDIQTIPDEYTRFRLPEVPSLNPVVYVGGEYQLTFEPDLRFDLLSKAQPGCYLITTSFFAPNANGDLNLDHLYGRRDRFAFTYNPEDGTGIYMNKDPEIPRNGNDSCEITLDVGQNYVSLSVIPDNKHTEAIFGRDVEVWSYNATTGWSEASEVEGGKGYYVYNPWAPKEITVYGTGVSLTWQEIYDNSGTGWNLIGIGNESLRMDGKDIPQNAVILKYRNGYPYPYDFMSLIPGPPGEKLEPGQAYWTYKIS